MMITISLAARPHAWYVVLSSTMSGSGGRLGTLSCVRAREKVVTRKPSPRKTRESKVLQWGAAWHSLVCEGEGEGGDEEAKPEEDKGEQGLAEVEGILNSVSRGILWRNVNLDLSHPLLHLALLLFRCQQRSS